MWKVLSLPTTCITFLQKLVSRICCYIKRKTFDQFLNSFYLFVPEIQLIVRRNTLWITLELTYPLEVVTDLKLALLAGDVGLDFSVRVVNDRQEHIEQDKEHEEDIGDKEDWTKDTIGSLQSMEVEITQDNTEQCKAAR